MFEAHTRLQDGDWEFRTEITGKTYGLRKKTLGIIGLGTIG